MKFFKIVKNIFSLSSLFLLLLLSFAIAIGTATFIENDYGTPTAWEMVYNTKWFEFIMLGLSLCFISNIFKYKLLQLSKLPILIFHLGFIIIILGAGITRYTSYSGVMRIREGEKSNLIVSDKNYLKINITEKGKKNTISRLVNFSKGNNGDFHWEIDVQGKKVKISNNNFIENASTRVVENESTGEAILELVTSSSKGRETHYLRKGTIQKIDNYEIGFNVDKKNIINIYEKKGKLQILSPYDLDFFIMSVQLAGKVHKDSIKPLQIRTLYNVGKISFVPLMYYPSAEVKIVNIEDKKNKNKNSLVTLDIEIGGEKKSITLPYKEGFLSKNVESSFDSENITLSYGPKEVVTPFYLQLNDFKLERYPGSDSPSAYASDITVIDGNEKIPYEIFMNNVLDYKGFRFFQASYDTDEKGTVLSVNHDFWGTFITYLGYILLGIGMFYTFFTKNSRFRFVSKQLSKLKKKSVLPIVMFFAFIGSSYSQTNFSEKNIKHLLQNQGINQDFADEFGKLLVQDVDGRIKPINTLALELIRKISRKTHFVYKKNDAKIKMDANQLFLAMHSAPFIWQQIPIIKYDKKKIILHFPELESKKEKLSFADLLNPEEKYILGDAVERANMKKPAQRDEYDKEILKIDERFNILFNLLSGAYIKVFPNSQDDNNTWYGYNHDFKNFNDEDGRFAKNIMPELLKDVALNQWKSASEKLSYISTFQKVLAKDIVPSDISIEAELWYNKLNVNFWLFQILFTYGLVMLLISIYSLFRPSKNLKAESLLVYFGILTLVVFSMNLILRWYIAQHAPWSNGYEMLVFVAWGILVCGFVCARHSNFSIPLAALFSGSLLFVSYLDWLNPEITNLMPVLKSYWLKIHVATIVSSYAPLALSSILGATALTLMNFKHKNPQIELKIKELTYINELSMVVGLFLLTVGTFLGGVWANESWGRYWAWDPKETWALVSIIVYAIILHLRFVPKLNNPYILNLASMFGFWSIIMTSFGVNYYLSGLHSYATGDPVPIPTFVYYIFGFMIIVGYLPNIKFKK